MKWLLLFAVLLPGCAKKYAPQIVVEGHPPRVYERTEGSAHIIEHRAWYDAEQLDQIVREYVRENKVSFDFRGTQPQFWVSRDRQHLANASYSSGFGRPMLSATIGWDGHVTEHDLSIAVEGPIGGHEPGSFRLDPESGMIADGKRNYAHADAARVIRLVIIDWMTNPNVKDQPYSYLIDPDNETATDPEPRLECLLIDERYVPAGLDLKIKGVRVALFDRSKRDLRKGEMCIRIDRFEPKADGSIEVEFLHSGYGIIGGAWVTYTAKKVEDSWSVEYAESYDP